MRVLITDSELGDGSLEREVLDGIGADLTIRDCRTEADVIAAVKEIDPHGLIAQWAPISAAVMAAAPSLRVISRYGVGVDTIDLNAAGRRGIAVRSVPHYCTEEVATHAVALGLSAWRRICELDRYVRAGNWDSRVWAQKITRMSDATIGIVGMGRIPQLVAPVYRAIGATVIFADPIVDSTEYERVSLDEIWRRSDLISLHAPLSEGTRHLINERSLSQMSRRPHIVNTSRGGLIDEAAIVDALASGSVATVSLDVFEHEPLPMTSALRDQPNVILSPHASWCSSQSIIELQRLAAQNIVDVLGASA